MFSIQKRNLMKQKLETAASNRPWRSISKFFFKLSRLEKIFENTSSWVMTDTYIQSWDIPENGLNKTLRTYQLIYFYSLNQQ